MTLTDVVENVKRVLTPRDVVVGRMEKLHAAHASAGGARAQAIAAVQAEVDALDEPRKRLARLQQEALSAGMREANELATLEAELKRYEPRDLVAFKTVLARLRVVILTPVALVPATDRLTGEVRTANLADVERRQRVVELVVRAEVEVRDQLWRLPLPQLSARIAEHRRALEEASTGDRGLENALA